jgi:tetratricopeptide (TPR) repeat protein
LTPRHNHYDEHDEHSHCCGGHDEDCCGGDHEDDTPYSVRARQLEILERVLNRMVKEGNFATAEEGSQHIESLLAQMPPEEVFLQLDLTPEEKSLLLVAEVARAESQEQAEKLLHKALEIDPNNIDAQVLLLEADDPATEAIHLEKIVRKAEETLGPDFFVAKQGQFYSDPETRPYLRARQALMVALGTAKNYDGAIKEAEGILDLCPQDHLGVRDYLAGYYLASSQYDKALDLLDKRYEADDGAVFQYARMMVHHKLGHETDAEEALEAALEANPYVLPVLLGVLNAEELAEDMTPGSPGQALYVIGALYDAMLENEPAMEWAANRWVERMRAMHTYGEDSEEES